jgi:hypothetical protein
MALCHYLEEIQGENKVVECLKGCALCFINCLEMITEYITGSAFSYIAVTGDGFCYGAYSALMLRLKHLAEFATTMFIAKIVIFIGKIAIVAANIFFFDTVLKAWFAVKVTSMIGPSVIVGVITWMMASIFLGMFETASDTMVTCHAIDCDLNNNEPKYGPQTFHGSWDAIKNSQKVLDKKEQPSDRYPQQSNDPEAEKLTGN